MVKKAPTPAKKQEPDGTKQLVDAIVTVRHLQDYIKDHGDLEKALRAADRVRKLIELTGGFDQLKHALGIVGREETPQQELPG